MWSPSGFFRNNLRYAPFGAEWLRGVTPARLGVVLVLCIFWSLAATRRSFFEGSLVQALQAWCRTYFSMLLGFIPMVLLVIRAEAGSREATAGLRIRALASSVLLGALAYMAIIMTVRYFVRGPFDLLSQWEIAFERFSRSFGFGALGAATLFYAAREREARRKLHEAQRARLDLDRQLAEVRLQLLQAQIEPHFLFNSLASVKRLYETQRSEGARLLRELRTYLEAAARSRGAEASLGEEIDLAKCFLRIFEVRMSGRLRVRVEVPDELRPALLPTFMLGTLVENAIKHGVAPRGTGGMVTLSARRRGDVLAVEVADNGVGFREHYGAGVGLANTRARLQSLFGRAAGVDIGANPAGGVNATLWMPYRVAAVKEAA